MKDEYTSALYDVVKETSATRGFDLPEPIEAYVVMLLSSYVDNTNFLPETTFGQTFFKLKTSDEAKKLGDTCLFVAGVFPSIGARKGISRRYYQDIGSSSYDMVAEVQNYQLFNTLATHFEFLSNFIEVTVNSAAYPETKFYH